MTDDQVLSAMSWFFFALAIGIIAVASLHGVG